MGELIFMKERCHESLWSASCPRISGTKTVLAERVREHRWEGADPSQVCVGGKRKEMRKEVRQKKAAKAPATCEAQLRVNRPSAVGPAGEPGGNTREVERAQGLVSIHIN